MFGENRRRRVWHSRMDNPKTLDTNMTEPKLYLDDSY